MITQGLPQKKTARRPGWNKYGAKVTYVDGKRFASKAEATRYAILLVRQNQGLIRKLECQVKYQFVVNGVKVGRYTADFRYEKKEPGQHGFPLLGEVWTLVVEDVKGKEARDFVLRKNLMLACHGITLQVVKRGAA